MDDKYKMLIDAIDSVVWYNCMGEGIECIYRQIEMCNEATFTRMDIDNPIKHESQFEVIWMIMVSMFGDYGTSPRYGWLYMENKEAILEFIKRITATYSLPDEIVE